MKTMPYNLFSLLHLLRDDPLIDSIPSGQPLLHVHRFCPQQHRTCPSSPHHPGVCLRNLLYPFWYTDLIICLKFLTCFFFFFLFPDKTILYVSGLALVVGLVLYISSINDEMLNRTKSSEVYFSYKYGWSFAFAALSFLLTEVQKWQQNLCFAPL